MYEQIIKKLSDLGAGWVQIDEPILTLDLPREWQAAYERVYNDLQRISIKKLLAVYFGKFEGNLS